MEIFYTQVEEMPLTDDASVEIDEIQSYLNKLASPDTNVTLKITAQNWKSNPEYLSGIPIVLSAPILLKASIQAEKDGFDAVILGGTWDYGLEAARSAVAIPVVGAGQTSLHVCAMLGERIGVISFRDEYTPEFYRRWRTYSATFKIVSFRSIGMMYTEFHSNKKELEKRFMEAAEKAINEDTADVIFANCVSFFPNLPPREQLEQKLGVPVVDSLGVSVKFAEMMVSLKYSQSRKNYPRIVDFQMDWIGKDYDSGGRI